MDESERQSQVCAAQLHAAERAFLAAQSQYDTACELSRPSMMLRPCLFIDGNQWCALHGKDLQNGVAGFGGSPDTAYRAFDVAWFQSLAPAQ